MAGLITASQKVFPAHTRTIQLLMSGQKPTGKRRRHIGQTSSFSRTPPKQKSVLSVVTMYREVVGQNKNHLNRVARGNAATLNSQVGRTSYVRNGSQVSSNGIFNLQ